MERSLFAALKKVCVVRDRDELATRRRGTIVSPRLLHATHAWTIERSFPGSRRVDKTRARRVSFESTSSFSPPSRRLGGRDDRVSDLDAAACTRGAAARLRVSTPLLSLSLSGAPLVFKKKGELTDCRHRQGRLGTRAGDRAARALGYAARGARGRAASGLRVFTPRFGTFLAAPKRRPREREREKERPCVSARRLATLAHAGDDLVQGGREGKTELDYAGALNRTLSLSASASGLGKSLARAGRPLL